MGRVVTERERLVSFAMTADQESLEQALELVRTALRTRFPAKRTKAAKAPKAKGAAVSPFNRVPSVGKDPFAGPNPPPED